MKILTQALADASENHNNGCAKINDGAYKARIVLMATLSIAIERMIEPRISTID